MHQPFTQGGRKRIDLLVTQGLDRHLFDTTQPGNLRENGLPLSLEFLSPVREGRIQGQVTLFHRLIELGRPTLPSSFLNKASLSPPY
jgi:hypothetical protein